MPDRLRLGWLVNPYAGVGGPAALKGSDAPSIQAQAQQGLLTLTAPARAVAFWSHLMRSKPDTAHIEVTTVPGPMGSDSLPSTGISTLLVDYRPEAPSSREDTRRAADALVTAGIDLLVFVGGDGTARDICAAVGTRQTVLGVPAGVKMHSGVYAINPQLAAELVAQMLEGRLVSVAAREVRDIDEEAFRRGVVKAKHFGEMLVPEEERLVQHVKQGGLEVEELVLLDIAEYLRDTLLPETLIILGPGSTTRQIAHNWRIESTLLGIDLVREGVLLAADVDAATLSHHLDLHKGPVLLVITAIGGQGHIIGRGNQQLTSEILRRIGRDRIVVVATRTKLKTLEGRPMVIDSGDPALDNEWRGYTSVLTGYDDRVLYPLGHPDLGPSLLDI